MNYEDHYDNAGDYKAYNLSGGFGYTLQVSDDITLYALGSVVIAYGNNNFYTYAYPQLGAMVYEIFNMKTNLEYKYVYNQNNSKKGYNDIKMEQSIFVNKKARIGLSVEYRDIGKEVVSSELSVNWYF